MTALCLAGAVVLTRARLRPLSGARSYAVAATTVGVLALLVAPGRARALFDCGVGGS